MNADTRARILRQLRDRPGAEAERWLQRASLQLEFARALARALPDAQVEGWNSRIAAASDELDRLDGSGGHAALQRAVLAAEEEMAPIGAIARQFTLHCVGHGHIDMNWMWSWPETVSTTHDTFASVLSLMDQYPQLTYSQSQASVYAIAERYYPELFDRIRARVKEGRWEVTAAHWVEGDKNLASGESICRHILYAREYARSRFGLEPEDVPVDWEPDTFGHAATVPTIVSQGAIRYYYSCRTGGGFEHRQHGESRPPLFYWQGPDGARVLVNRETTWYNSYVNIGDNIALPLAEFVHETGLHHWLNVYGIGNHGGGPTRKEIEYYLWLQELPVYPRIEFSTSKRYFEAVDAEIQRTGASVPIIAHELNYEFTGCYTSQSLIKRANRLGENMLEEAETLAALAARLARTPYPRELLREAWINVLFNQFHDILPGSGVRETREHAQALFQETGAIAGAVKRTASLALAAGVDTLSLLPATPEGVEERAAYEAGTSNTPFVAGAGMGSGLTGFSHASGGGQRFLPFIVYNPSAWTRTGRVSVSLYDSDLDASRVVARDPSGANHPVFFAGKGHDWGHDRLDFFFEAQDLPPLGHKVYLLCEGAVDAPWQPVQAMAGDWFETPYLRFRVDRLRSGLLELWDRTTGARIDLGGGFGAWNLVKERPRGMTAWALGDELDAPEPLRARSFRVQGAQRNQGTNALVGPGAPAYRVESTLSVPGTQSAARVCAWISGSAPQIDFEAQLDWREIGSAESVPGLAIDFPLALQGLRTFYEVPFGSVERKLFDGEEVPALRYAHAAGQAEDRPGHQQPAAVTIVQDSRYGHSARGSTLRLRVVRSSIDPDHAPEIAISALRYSIFLHPGLQPASALSRLGAAHNHPLVAWPAQLQSGPVPPLAGAIQVEPPNILLTALKQTEDGGGLLLRLVEMDGVDTEAVVRLAEPLARGITQARVTDLMERPSADARWGGSTLRVDIKSHGFVTVKLQ